MTNAALLTLDRAGEIDPRGVLTGPLRAIRRVHLAPGERREAAEPGSETSVFVLAGGGLARSGSVRVALHYGLSVTAPLGTDLVVVAGDEGLEYYLLVLDVHPDPATGGTDGATPQDGDSPQDTPDQAGPRPERPTGSPA
jgi:hypothetical protein